MEREEKKYYDQRNGGEKGKDKESSRGNLAENRSKSKEIEKIKRIGGTVGAKEINMVLIRLGKEGQKKEAMRRKSNLRGREERIVED